MIRHNFRKYCYNGCKNYRIVSGDSACDVTGTRLTTTRLATISEVGCASFDNGFNPNTDPLTLLEVWMRYESERGFKNYNHSQVVIAICGMINNIRTNADAVRERGTKEGWWKE